MNDANKRKVFDFIVWSMSLLFVFALLIHSALADSRLSAAPKKTYQAECGSCHIPYSPALLPAPAWRRMMAGLTKHFGTDAGVDARVAAEIGAFLETQAAQGSKRGSDSGVLRITETPWFTRKHDEVPAAAWKSPKVLSAANCGACHSGAERIPR